MPLPCRVRRCEVLERAHLRVRASLALGLTMALRMHVVTFTQAVKKENCSCGINVRRE
jgi:hypothetical protein